MMLETALTGKGRVAVFKLYQPGVKQLSIHRLIFDCGGFPSMALFVPIMAVANESIDLVVVPRYVFVLVATAM